MKTMILFFALLVFDILLINFAIFLFDKYQPILSIPLIIIILLIMIFAAIKYLKLTNNTNEYEEEKENEDN